MRLVSLLKCSFVVALGVYPIQYSVDRQPDMLMQYLHYFTLYSSDWSFNLHNLQQSISDAPSSTASSSLPFTFPLPLPFKSPGKSQWKKLTGPPPHQSGSSCLISQSCPLLWKGWIIMIDNRLYVHSGQTVVLLFSLANLTSEKNMARQVKLPTK